MVDFNDVKKLLGEHDDQVDSALDKLGDLAKQKFAGHDDQIDKFVQMGKDYDFSGGENQAQGGENQAQGQAPEQAPPPAQ